MLICSLGHQGSTWGFAHLGLLHWHTVNSINSFGAGACVISTGINLEYVMCQPWLNYLVIRHQNLQRNTQGAQWLSGRVLDSRSWGCRFEPHRCHGVVSLSKTDWSLLSTGSTHSTQEDLIIFWLGRKESKQTKIIKATKHILLPSVLPAESDNDVMFCFKSSGT